VCKPARAEALNSLESLPLALRVDLGNGIGLASERLVNNAKRENLERIKSQMI
jgi:hypothetical protein